MNRGRYHSYLLDGQKVSGVTTIIGDGIPKPKLIGWAANETAKYAVDHWDELAADPSAVNRLRTLERSRFLSRDEAANRGTEVHVLATRLAAGEEVTVPEALTGHVDAYLKFVEDWQPEELLVEAPVFHRSLRYAGTLDLVARLADGWTWLLDYKTGGKGVFPETAVQLAAYRNAEFYLDERGDERPLPPIDYCGAVWLRADGYDFYRLDASDRTFLVFRYAQQLAQFAKDADDGVFISDALDPPAKEAA